MIEDENVYCLNYGGVERVCIDYMRLLKTKGHEIDLYILSKKEQDMRVEVRKHSIAF